MLFGGRLDPLRWLAVGAVAGVCARHAAGQPWEFTKIADYGTHVPGGTGTFRHVGFSAPGIHDGRVAFAGQNQAAVFEGIYSWDRGTLGVVANTSTAIPNGQGNFIGFPFFYSPSLAGQQTAFLGNGFGKLFIQQGIYLQTGASLERVVDRATAIPNSTANFFALGGPSLDRGAVAFPGFSLNPAIGGVYRWESGTIDVVADHTTPIPGGSGLFNNFGETDIHQGVVAVAGRGAGGQTGLYLGHPGGSLTRLYDTSTPVPGGGGAFTFFAQPSLENGRVAFYARTPNTEGVYSDASGTLVTLAQTGMPVPGLPGNTFLGSNTPSLDNGYVVFYATISGPSGGFGLFTNYGGEVSKIISTGDMLDGRIVDGVTFSRGGHSGDTIAFGVIFTDGWRGVYMGTIPAPATGVVVAVGMLAAARRRR